MNFFKALMVMGTLSTWLEAAIKDQVIDQDEILNLIKQLLSVLGVKAEIKVDTE